MLILIKIPIILYKIIIINFITNILLIKSGNLFWNIAKFKHFNILALITNKVSYKIIFILKYKLLNKV